MHKHRQDGGNGDQQRARSCRTLASKYRQSRPPTRQTTVTVSTSYRFTNTHSLRTRVIEHSMYEWCSLGRMLVKYSAGAHAWWRVVRHGAPMGGIPIRVEHAQWQRPGMQGGLKPNSAQERARALQLQTHAATQHTPRTPRNRSRTDESGV